MTDFEIARSRAKIDGRPMLLVFSGSDYTTLMMMKREVENALIMWEPRIKDINADVTAVPNDNGKLIINVSYVVRSTNNPFNLVYPFYINEGYGDTER